MGPYPTGICGDPESDIHSGSSVSPPPLSHTDSDVQEQPAAALSDPSAVEDELEEANVSLCLCFICQLKLTCIYNKA